MSIKEFRGVDGLKWSYDDTKRIGSTSGAGKVFEGWSEDGSAVAVKVVGLVTGFPGEILQRAREFEIGTALSKSAGQPPVHIMPTLDAGNINDDLLLVMPRAEHSLDDAIRTGMTDDQKREAVEHVLLGLQEIAGKGVLHRDIKPANVLYHEGRWKIADFGQSRLLASSAATHTFVRPGTSAYVAPEIWEGKTADVKTELYALGVLIFEVFTESKPFPGPDEEAFRHQHLNEAAAVPVDWPSALKRLVSRLLSKDRNERPEDARAAHELWDVLNEDMSADQQALLDAAADLEEQRALTDAHRRGLVVKQATKLQRRTQAAADIRSIIERAADRIRMILPETTLTHDGAQWHFQNGGSSLTIRLYPNTPEPVVQDLILKPLVANGEVTMSFQGVSVDDRYFPVSGGVALNVANVACEEDDDGRLDWQLIRFERRASANKHQYFLGPAEGLHGLNEDRFYELRPYMVDVAEASFDTQIEVLDASAIVEMFTATLRYHSQIESKNR